MFTGAVLISVKLISVAPVTLYSGFFSSLTNTLSAIPYDTASALDM
jgi:hypothetical protein